DTAGAQHAGEGGAGRRLARAIGRIAVLVALADLRVAGIGDAGAVLADLDALAGGAVLHAHALAAVGAGAAVDVVAGVGHALVHAADLARLAVLQGVAVGAQAALALRARGAGDVAAVVDAHAVGVAELSVLAGHAGARLADAQAVL